MTALSPAAAAGRLRRLGRRAAEKSPFDGLVILLILVIGGLIILPLAQMLKVTFIQDGFFGFDAFSSAFSSRDISEALYNTARVSAISSTAAVALAAVFAWVNERSDARLGWVSDAMPLLPMLVHPLVSIIGLVYLFDPTAGIGNVALRSWLGLESAEGPLNIYSISGMIVTTTIFLVPFAYLPIAAGLQNLDPSFEEAARSSGCTPLQAMRRITLPAVRPAIASAFLLTFSFSLTLFSIPVILGPPANEPILSVRIFQMMTQFPPETDQAVVLCGVILVAVLAAWGLQRWILQRSAFARVGGKSAGISRVRLGLWKLPIRLSMVGYVAVTAVVPFLALAVLSVQPFWTQKPTFEGATLSNYQNVFAGSSVAGAALRNSVLLGVTGATILVVILAVIATYVHRYKNAASRTMDGLTKLPATLPHLVLAVGFILAFAGSPLYLQGTTTLLLLAYLVFYLPQGTMVVGAAAAQIGDDLIDSARTAGAFGLRVFTRVQLPLLLPSLVAAWTIAFVLMMGDVTGSAVLAGPQTPVVGKVVLNQWEEGGYPSIAALGVVVSLVTTSVIVGIQALGRRLARHRIDRS